jgi:hypothetical protein
MEKDPYDCGYRLGKFDIHYLGREQDWYVVTVYQRGHVGLDVCMMDRDIFNWLFEEIGPDGFFMQKAGGAKDPEHPKLILCEGDGFNTKILLKRFADLVALDQAFGLSGLSKLMLAEA